MSIALEGLQEDAYRLVDLQALRYDPKQMPFHEGYLGKLYGLCKKSRITTTIFGGNPPSTFDAIVSYLAARPIIVLGEWELEPVEVEEGEEARSSLGFKEAGFCFPIIMCGQAKPELAAFCGYGFFRHVWGKPELPVLAMLGLAYLFQEFGLKAIHGTRYEDNILTKRFMRQFGMKDVGLIPNYQLRDGVLVPAVVSSLDRADFEKYVENYLVEQYRATLQAEPAPEPVKPQEPEKPQEPPQLSLSWLDIK